VLFPAYFHGVELEALLEAGVRPRFYPVQQRMRVDPAEVEKRIGPETRAIYLIHYVGFPGPVEELRELCDRRGLLLVEDCALALLSCQGDRPLGTFGDASIFCLYKTLPTPNGGALVIRGGGPIGLPEGDPPPVAATFSHAASSLLVGLELSGGAAGRVLRRVARGVGRAAARVVRAQRVPTGTQHFDRSRVGLAMSRLSRRVIEAQDFPAIVERRRRNYFHLLGRLRDLAPPVFGQLPPGVCPLFFPFAVRDKQTVLRRLHARGVDAVDFWRVGHPAVPPGSFPEVDELRQTILELPCHQDLAPTAIDRLAAIVHEVVRGRG
jgi:dTDP-4-amino-4,6-dideoxygalactose transaminase